MKKAFSIQYWMVHNSARVIVNFTESSSSSTWLFKQRVKHCAEAPAEPGDTSYAHQGPQLLKTQLPKRTDTCGVGMCVRLSRFPEDGVQLPHTAPDRYTVCAVCLPITRIPPTETSEVAADSSASPDQQMWEAFLYLLTYFYPFKGWHSGGFKMSVTWLEPPEKTLMAWYSTVNKISQISSKLSSFVFRISTKVLHIAQHTLQLASTQNDTNPQVKFKSWN